MYFIDACLALGANVVAAMMLMAIVALWTVILFFFRKNRGDE